MKIAVTAAAVLSMLSGCAPVGMPVAGEPVADQCGARDLRYLVGSSETVLQTMRFGNPVRIIPAGSAVTMDFNPGRLNIELDESGNISRIRCG